MNNLIKEEEPVKRVGKRKKQKARKGISIDKSPQGDSETDKEESVEAMNPTPLDTKSNIVANWKIFQQGERSIYQIIRANGADTVYMSFGAMLKDFTREDLIELYRLVMQKYGTNRPEDAYDRVLWSDLRTMFDPPLNEDAIWSLPLQQKMISWRYYDKCAVHCLTLEACNIYMLADRKYPLSKDACQVMLKMKLLDGKMNEVCYKLLKMIEKQAGEDHNEGIQRNLKFTSEDQVRGGLLGIIVNRLKSGSYRVKSGRHIEVEKVVSTAEVTTESATTTTVDELTLAQTLIEIKAAKPKVRGVMIQEPSEFTTTTTTTTPAASKPSQDKGKAKMIESEKPLKKKDQIMYDQEVALNLQAQLQAELEEEERLTRQKEEEANIALIESWDNTQAMMDADYQMAQQLQAEEQEQLSIEEKSKLFVQLLEARKKHFAEMRAREKRNKPPTQAQQRKLYCNYLKNMEGYTLKQLKGFKFEVIKDMFDKAFKRVNTFVDYKTELVEGSEKRAEDSTKRAGIELEQEVAKKQKIDDDQEEAEMKKLIKVVLDEEEVEINAIPLATNLEALLTGR
ncbi:hypothetical protein Tco_0536968 [Tanacetum coccineum]